SGGVPTLAVRVPDHPGLRRLLAGLGPLTATSANRTGQPPALSADAAARIFGSGLDFVVDAGPSENVVPSTIVDLTKSPPEILRSGAFPWSYVRAKTSFRGFQTFCGKACAFRVSNRGFTRALRGFFRLAQISGHAAF